jgi:predicted amidohydrolase YtcJ
MTRILADIVLKEGLVLTMDPQDSVCQSVCIKKDRIIFAGSNKEVKQYIGPKTRVIDLKGCTVLPGINDSHMHGLFLGVTKPPLSIDLRYPNVKSFSDIVNEVLQKAGTLPEHQWIFGYGWNQSFFKEDFLTQKEDMDNVSKNHPLFLVDFSGHNVIVNRIVLKKAGINRDTKDPDGGRIERDPATGEPTGVLIEFPAVNLVKHLIPSFTREQKRLAIESAIKILQSYGITSFTDAGLGPGGDEFFGGSLGQEGLEIYKEICQERKLGIRVNILLLLGKYGIVTYEDVQKNISWLTEQRYLNDNWLRIGGAKIFADGLPRTQTAWMHEPYLNGENGSLILHGSDETAKCSELIKMIELLHRNEFQIGVHTTGDKAVDSVVDGFLSADEKCPNKNLRHYIIHGNFITPSCAARMALNGIGLSIQPAIQPAAAKILAGILGKKRALNVISTKMCLDAGITIAASSDTPVLEPDWREGIRSAVQRSFRGEDFSYGLENRVSLMEALRMYTINGAWLDHMEMKKGSIENGKLADICILENNILTTQIDKIPDIPVSMTIVGGEIVFDNSGGQFE